MKYSDSPERNKRREMVTSVKSSGIWCDVLSKVSETSDMPCAGRLAVPLKITSIICWLRSDLADISPKAQRMESEILDLPQPFGPTTAVIPASKSTRVFSAKD